MQLETLSLLKAYKNSDLLIFFFDFSQDLQRL